MKSEGTVRTPGSWAGAAGVVKRRPYGGTVGDVICGEAGKPGGRKRTRKRKRENPALLEASQGK